MLALEDAVRYPGIARKAFLIVVAGLALLFLFFVVSRNVWGSVAVGFLAWIIGIVLTIGRDNRVMDVASRIFDEHPWYTAREAANAARRELGLQEVRYP